MDEKSVPDSRSERFVRRLAHAHKSRSAGLAAARRWRPGVVDHRIAALVCLDSEPASATEYPWWAQTAKLFAIWHGGRADTSYGYPGNGIGKWAHQLGVGDLTAERLIARIAHADTPVTLDTALSALARQRTPRPPHWATVLAELTAWDDPAQRDTIRYKWARDFYSFPARADQASPQTVSGAK
ncbi:hypothetical protein F0Q45_19835 [Mycobacterium simiae]|uniref:Type I-E CRISPR-associated protein Cse2/CasB n=1 Tax=Mycobacterium simiae TaxID=1784 RepID=A0A5B1BNJ1_MYCSI|nr:type I-E CRISPR-associated protein Cse2/CasB [Mycobacterium simiae]KAA1248579.1 hypothetical protein F0Q45_19835 [Mycobacterium simiae]